MKTVFLCSLLCYLTKAEYSVRCNNSSRSGLSFEPSSDGVEGRYTVDWCTTADRNVTNWELSMRYDDTRAPEQCKKFDIRFRPGRLHSRFNRILNIDLNCTDVCFSTNLDLVFNGTCYHIKSWLRRGSQSSTPHDSVHYIINQSVKEHFTLSEARVAAFSNNERFEVHWYLGYVPVTDFQVELCTEDFLCSDVCANCSAVGARRNELRCELRAPHACYSVRLHQRAPWSAAAELFRRQLHLDQRVCHEPAHRPPAQPQRAAPWVPAAAAAAALLLLLLLLHLQRARQSAALRLRVLRDWRNRPAADPARKPLAGAEAGERRIVLLYARDCAPFTRVAELLRQLLADGTGCQVIDLYSAETVRAAAAAPAEWLQAALGSARVVLLQSPAAHALYAPAAPLRGPALGAVVRAAPHSSDWLLALALRRLAESGHAGLPYRRYFVAEIAGLEAEVLPHLTQLRRYSLPAAAELLLRDLAPPPPQPPQPPQLPPPPPPPPPPQLGPRLQQLSQAVDELRRFVRDNPDYIADLFHVC